MNSLYQQLNPQRVQNNSQLLSKNNLKQLVNTLKISNNPKQILIGLINNNPQMKDMYTLLQSSNKNPKQFFYTMASQKGINPQEILELLK